MTASSRAPLINRPMVGILAIVGLTAGPAVLMFGSFDNAWGASLLRVGIVLAIFWFALSSAKPHTPRSPVSMWVTGSLAGFALLAVRSRKPVMFFLVGIVFTIVAFAVRPRQKRS